MLSFLHRQKPSASSPRVLETPRGQVTVIARCPADEIAKLGIDAELGFFWHNRSDLQHQALMRIAALPDGNVTLAHNQDRVIVGYVTVAHPDPDTRWGRDRIPGLYELGGIEVARSWRSCGIGRALLTALFADGSYDDAIVIATGYRWCWDYESSGLTLREYREVLHRTMQRAGFEFFATDEPNIAWYPDNALVARIGKRAPKTLVKKFKGLLFENLGSEYVMGEFIGR
ncbi:MAG: GNAT family N-acetyltransferase [Anaerolineae bacterium]|nr:GNAT family N-acetyltransferase [Anaerolineae bacterium]